MNRATLSPTIATEMIKSGLAWNYFYYTLLGGSILEFIVGGSLFWGENAARFRANTRRSPSSGGGSRTTEATKSFVTWLMALWLFIYMGVEGMFASGFPVWMAADDTAHNSVSGGLDRRLHGSGARRSAVRVGSHPHGVLGRSYYRSCASGICK